MSVPRAQVLRKAACSALATALLGAGAMVHAEEDFRTRVTGFVEHYCLDCHSRDKAEADVNFEPFLTEEAVRGNLFLWEKAAAQVHQARMPPVKRKTQPESGEREQFQAWVREALEAARQSQQQDPGRPRLRRLNKSEYANTLRAWLGIEGDPAAAFPADGSGGEGFSNNGDTLFLPPVLVESYLQVAETTWKELSEQPELRARFLLATPSGELSPEQAARNILEKHLPLAFRRPVREGEIERYLALFHRTTERGRSFEEGMQMVFKALLLAPEFLFLVEEDRPEEKQSWRVGSFELANRLSYFLWSAPPDDTLRSLARDNQLQDDATLEREVKRMLSDPRASALAREFGGHWLCFDQVLEVQPAQRKSTEFPSSLRTAMYEEALRYCDDILRHNGSFLQILDSRHTFVNEELGQYYGMKEVKGPEWRRVELTDPNRGGVLTMGAILTFTSRPQRTSPVLRGKWILEQILGTPPPPPPPDVGNLPANTHDKPGITLRQLLENHRNRASCMSCHSRMDPLGFALENFDNFGRWRDQENGIPIDASGALPDGTQIGSPVQLRQVLLTRKDKFARNLVQKMLCYALGRSIEPCDLPTILQLSEGLERNGFKSENLVIDLVKSFPFRHRRNPLEEQKKME